MREVARTLLLVCQHFDAHALAVAAGALPHLPEEIWLTAFGFLRSANCVPPNL